MNNGGTIPLITPLTEAQQACVSLLAEALEEAKLGRVNSVAIVLDMKTGFASVIAGMGAANLNLGCDELKAKILGAVVDDKRSTPRSRIVPARPA